MTNDPYSHPINEFSEHRPVVYFDGLNTTASPHSGPSKVVWCIPQKMGKTSCPMISIWVIGDEHSKILSQQLKSFTYANFIHSWWPTVSHDVAIEVMIAPRVCSKCFRHQSVSIAQHTGTESTANNHLSIIVALFIVLLEIHKEIIRVQVQWKTKNVIQLFHSITD